MSPNSKYINFSKNVPKSPISLSQFRDFATPKSSCRRNLDYHSSGEKKSERIYKKRKEPEKSGMTMKQTKKESCQKRKEPPMETQRSRLQSEIPNERTSGTWRIRRSLTVADQWSTNGSWSRRNWKWSENEPQAPHLFQ